jgi:medium-chain acyl-[acyl-carrier-protein] hydrolase
MQNTILSDENLSLITPFKIGSHDTDMEARLRPGTLLSMLIQSAIHSSDNLGFGFADIQRLRLFWVCSRLSLEIIRPLKWYEEITIETWPKNLERIIYLRDFLVRDAAQKVVARGTSGWLAIDLDSKKPKRIEDTNAEMFVHLNMKHGLEYSPERLSKVKEGESFEHNATYFDIDLNKHVTSSRYVDWMMDSFSPEFHAVNYPKKIALNYMQEVKLGEKIELIRQNPENKLFLFEGLHADSGDGAFRGKIEF